MRKLIGLAAVACLLLAAAAPPTEAAKLTGTYWLCTSNGVSGSHGTTQIHLHKHKPSPRHLRRHHCVKRTIAAHVTPGTVVTLPDGSKVVVGPGGTINITINVSQGQSQNQSQSQSGTSGSNSGGDDEGDGGGCQDCGHHDGGDHEGGHHGGGHGNKGCD